MNLNIREGFWACAGVTLYVRFSGGHLGWLEHLVLGRPGLTAILCHCGMVYFVSSQSLGTELTSSINL